MNGPALDHCSTCGQPASVGAICPHCGRSLRVDLVLRSTLVEPRAAFRVARAIAELAGVGLTFAQAKAALDRGGPLVRGLDRAPARALLGLLAQAGVATDVRPSSANRNALVGAGAAALVVAAAVVALLGRTAPPGASASPGPTTGPAGTAAAPPAGPAARGAPPGSSPHPVPSTSEILAQVTPATATLTCQGQTGAGFFVDSDRLLTNAHVVCGPTEGVQITTGDGRSLLGTVEAMDAWLDWALVRVPGAGVVAPLVLGDPTALAPADPVLLIGAPRGLAGTVHAGKVSFVGRNLNGVAFLQLNADVNPGNSGGPVLDDRGRVVGIVSLKITGADGLGMALPVEYARPALGGLPPLDEAATARFVELRRRVEAEDAAEVARMRTALDRPVLLGARPAGPQRLTLVVMQRWAGPPDREVVATEIHQDGQVLCRPQATVSEWVDLQRTLRERYDPRTERRLAWLLRNGLLAGVHAGAGPLSLSSCPDTLDRGARLRLEGADGDDAWAPLAPGTVDPVQREAWRVREAAEADAARLREAGQRRQAETLWRDAFARAKTRVHDLTVRRDQLRSAGEGPRLPAAERELGAAQEALDRLERSASEASVPREWR